MSPELLSRQLREIRVGASLRGLEATIQGTVLQTNAGLALRLAGSRQLVRLFPASTVVRHDVRRPFAPSPSPAEQAAYERLLAATAAVPERFAQVSGAVRRGAREPAMEVREFHIFEWSRSGLRFCDLTLKVSGPYGLAEFESLIREPLLRIEGVQGVSRLPGFDRCRLEVRPGVWLERERLAVELRRIGIGIELREMQAVVDGWLIFRDGEYYLDGQGGNAQLRGVDPVLTRGTTRHTRPVRVYGPVVESAGAPGAFCIEVQHAEFDLRRWNDAWNGRNVEPELVQRPDPNDRVPPESPSEVTASFQGGVVVLAWEPSRASDLNGYNIFRALHPGGEWIQLAAGVTSNEYRFYCGLGHSRQFYRVSATDLSGNESLPSGFIQAPAP